MGITASTLLCWLGDAEGDGSCPGTGTNVTHGTRQRLSPVHLAAAVVEWSDDAIFTQTLDGIIISWNPAAQRIYGYTAREAIGRSVTMLVPAGSAEQLPDILARLRRGEGLIQYETVWQRRNGTRVDVSLTISPIADSSGRIVAAAAIGRDITGRKQAEQALRRLNAELQRKAFHDALTDLPNRALFADRLRQALARARRYRTRVAVLLIDLDGFKHINDTYGHDAGDAALVEIARRLQACVRQADTVARWGGDEFSALLTDVRTREDAARVAEHIVTALRRPVTIRGQDVDITASIGISLFPTDGEFSDELVRRADHAMYRAKHELQRSGRVKMEILKNRGPGSAE
jgi:diguanylate cyclase (GGDEF)-like protein/PAS domain S-box-containing protein